jgi:hypothetical protein
MGWNSNTKVIGTKKEISKANIIANVVVAVVISALTVIAYLIVSNAVI